MRKKMKLDVESLEVTSFETHRGDAERGTVRGHIPPPATRVDITCNWTCGYTYCDERTCHYSCASCSLCPDCY